jgi:hypothetical protein
MGQSKLTKCPDCGKEVSKSAKVCPNCGRNLENKMEDKIFRVVAVVFFGCMFYAYVSRQESEPLKVEDRRIDIGLSAEVELRYALNDPESLETDKTFIMDDDSVCMYFRAKNGFGGVIRSSAVYANNVLSVEGYQNFNFLWNKHCVGKAGVEIMDLY